jgi:hypothetical protein
MMMWAEVIRFICGLLVELYEHGKWPYGSIKPGEALNHLTSQELLYTKSVLFKLTVYVSGTFVVSLHLDRATDDLRNLMMTHSFRTLGRETCSHFLAET